MNVQEARLKGSEPSTEFLPGLSNRGHSLSSKRVLGAQSKEQNESGSAPVEWRALPPHPPPWQFPGEGVSPGWTEAAKASDTTLSPQPAQGSLSTALWASSTSTPAAALLFPGTMRRSESSRSGRCPRTCAATTLSQGTVVSPPGL